MELSQSFFSTSIHRCGFQKTLPKSFTPPSYAIKFLIPRFPNKSKQQQETKNINGCNSWKALFLFSPFFHKTYLGTAVIKQSNARGRNQATRINFSLPQLYFTFINNPDPANTAASLPSIFITLNLFG